MQQIPCGIHDWRKFIKPRELTTLMQLTGFKNIEIKGFNLFGNTLGDYFAAYWRYKKTGGFSVWLNDNTSLMYIGKAEKIGKITTQENALTQTA